MHGTFYGAIRRGRWVLLTAVLTATPLLLPTPALASDPQGATISSTGPAISYVGTAVGTGCAEESTAVEGVNADTFVLTVQGSAASWKGKLLQIAINWTVPANDYDLYVHSGSNSGPVIASSTNGAPETGELCTIDPSVIGPGTYTVHTVYFATTPSTDQYHGTIGVIAKPAGRTANYQRGGMTFSANRTVSAPVTVSDGEPSSRTDIFGNHYVAGIRGVPAGCDLWWFDLRPGSPTFDPNMRNPLYRGQPDSFTGQDLYAVGADGGGDVDLAVGFGASGANDVPQLAFVSLLAANISASTSADLGNSFLKNPAGNVTGGVPADDRQWIEFYGKSDVYLAYRTLDPAVCLIQHSKDGGLTWGPARTAGQIGQIGGISIDQRDGTVYVAGGNGVVAVGVPDPTTGEPLTYTVRNVASDPNGVAHIFFIVKCAPDGTLYAAYSNDSDIFLESSTDKGQTWSLPVKVNSSGTKVNVLPALACGPSSGSVGVAWYGTTNSANNDAANWNVFYAFSPNATSYLPTFNQVQVSDHVIHASNISENGLSVSGGANRNLLDYFQISFDPQGAAVIDFTDDHNDFTGCVYVSREIKGFAAGGGYLPSQSEGGQLLSPTATSSNGPQVVDDPFDVADALLVRVPTADPVDVLSIQYSDAIDASGNISLTATMKVSDMSYLPPSSTWRMDFAANAPYARTRAGLNYSDGLPDRGDQFYLAANTDAQGNKTFTWGTAVRNDDGSITYTAQGSADSGLFDPTNKAITVSLAASRLTPLMTHGPAIASGSVLCGLRGSAFTVSGLAREDDTRGGTSFTVK